MKDRKQVPGGISQQEVLASSCPNTATLSIPFMVNNGWNIEKFQLGLNSPSAQAQQQADAESPERTNSQQQQPPAILSTSAGIVTSYAACSNSDDWFISPKVITCSSENRIYGFAPDPKDCSKFYICDQNVAADAGSDSASKGYLMACVGGLWWDQGRRMCASPMEVSCNPFNIINAQAGTSKITRNKSANYFFPALLTQILLTFYVNMLHIDRYFCMKNYFWKN